MSLPPLFTTVRLQGPVHTNSHLYQIVSACSPFTLAAMTLVSITSQKLHNSPFLFRLVQLRYETRAVHVSSCVTYLCLGDPTWSSHWRLHHSLACKIVQKLGNAGGRGSSTGIVARLGSVWPRNRVLVSGRRKRVSSCPKRPYRPHASQPPIQFASGAFS
jgi:hypothetical protein